MIYGEELKQIDVSKGLWLADDLDAVPEGYTANQVNLINTPTGALEVRPNFIPIGSFTSPATLTLSSLDTGFFTEVGENVYERGVQCFDVQPNTTTDPVAILAYDQGTPSICWISQSGAVTTSATGGANILMDIAQYRDRHYGLEDNVTVCRYQFTGAFTFVRTLLFNTGGYALRGLTTFRDRIFAYSLQNRIFYTELAATGGYPDNWNSGNNFFDLPDSGAQIRNCIVHNDRMYIFTTMGVYVLYASGSPSTWQVQSVNRDIVVFNKNSVQLINGNFIFTDTKSVYTYAGGSSYLDIGLPIQGALRSRVSDFAIPLETSVQTYNGPSGFRIMPFMGSFLLVLDYYDSSGVRERLPKYYYYNESTTSWAEIQFDTDLSGSNRGHALLVGGFKFKNFLTATTARKMYPAFVELRFNSNTTQALFDVLTVREDNSDIDINNFQTNFGLFTQDKQLSNYKLSRIKEIKLDLRTSLSTATATPYVDGVNGTSTAMSFATVGSRKERIEVSIQRGNSIALSLSGAVSKAVGPGGDQSLLTWPSFRLNGIGVVTNTDTRLIPNQEYAS